ncbi:MAG: DUF1127 domain-containing protein [Alphaproteobacteria bacterium]|nr:DUF1127 domain-containing protein [Alphaproteobacteria bacterium]
MSTQNDILRVPSALPEDPYALVARARAMRSTYIRNLIVEGFKSLRDRLAHRRTLAAVEDLSPRMLADIGLDITALRAGVIRRADAEVLGTPSDAYLSATAPKTANPVEPHLRPAAPAAAANTDVRHAA